MKKIISLSTLIVFLLLGCGEKHKPELTDQIKAGLRADAQQFMGSLKSILVKEMQTNGIVSAVSVCSDTAQHLTNNFGINKGIYIKRVSFKNRNKNNTPNNIESDALNNFEELKLKGELTENTEYFSTIDEAGVAYAVYLKPIIVQAPCLGCHGTLENINQEVKTLIEKKYPNDKAIGYKLDDLRGAISIKKIYNSESKND